MAVVATNQWLPTRAQPGRWICSFLCVCVCVKRGRSFARSLVRSCCCALCFSGDGLSALIPFFFFFCVLKIWAPRQIHLEVHSIQPIHTKYAPQAANLPVHFRDLCSAKRQKTRQSPPAALWRRFPLLSSVPVALLHRTRTSTRGDVFFWLLFVVGSGGDSFTAAPGSAC